MFVITKAKLPRSYVYVMPEYVCVLPENVANYLPIAKKHIVARAPQELVRAGTSGQKVVAVAAINDIVILFAGKKIPILAAKNDIIPIPAEYRIPACVTPENILGAGPIPGGQVGIGTYYHRIADDYVIAVAAADLILSRQSAEIIIAALAIDVQRRGHRCG
jgi:hypothetical protein